MVNTDNDTFPVWDPVCVCSESRIWGFLSNTQDHLRGDISGTLIFSVQPLELGEMNVCCLGHLAHDFLFSVVLQEG